tara:strand:+ start:1665 stop:2072 length:408 start_codon:yes stop_codon:yes gene_type:complete
MASRRDRLVKQLMRSVTGEDEATLMKLTVERVCADMCEFYKNFYKNEGPGAMVYVPEAIEEKKSMFYLNLEELKMAVNDLNKRDMSGVADVMKNAINRAESIEPEKEAIFIIQDKERMSLIHYKLDCEGANFTQM